MAVITVYGKTPDVGSAAFVAPNATLAGDVVLAAGSSVWYGAVVAMARGAGACKVLYGSDAYWNSMEAAVGRILLAELTDEEKRQILGLNAKRLFHLDQPQRG